MVPSVSVRDTMRVVTPRISSIRRTRADTVKVFLSGNQNLTTHVSAFLRVRLLILNVNGSQNQHRRESTVTSVGISNAGFATALKKSTGGVAFLCIFLVSSTLYKHNSIPAYQISGCTISSSSCSHSGTHGQNDTVLNQSSALPLSRSLILLSRRPVLRGFLDVRPNNLLQRDFATSQEIALEGIHPSTNLPELGG